MQPLLQWKGNKYYIFGGCVCSLRDPAYNAHAPYCHLWPVQLYNIFPRHLINGTHSFSILSDDRSKASSKTALFAKIN
jgi:hypothetical protein